MSRWLERMALELGHHHRPHTPRHYYGVKCTVTAMVLVAIFAPHLTELAVLGNLLWIWVDP